MEIKVSQFVPDITVAEAISKLQDPRYLERVSTSTELINSAIQIPDGFRYVAPTRLPKLLKRFEKKAPPTVGWDEISNWTETGRTFRIVADAPDHWHDYYDAEGVTSVIADGNGVIVTETLTFELTVNRIWRSLEKTFKADIKALLTARLSVI